MNIKDFILGYLIGKQDGGGEASVEPLEVTENGTYSEEGVAYSPVTVNVAGGASNIITGTFKPSAEGATETVDLGYTGNGYPIAALVAVDGGMYDPNSEWYSLDATQKVGMWAMVKSKANIAPVYTGSQANQEDTGTTMATYQFTSGSPTIFQYNGFSALSVFAPNPITSNASNVIKFPNKKTMAYYAKARNSSYYGLLNGITYRYWIVYSE